MRRRTFRGAVAVMALTTAALIGTAGSALACYPSDDRATPVPKTNVTTCEDAKLPGETLVRSDELPTDVIDIEGGVPNKDKTLTIKQVAKGVTITAVVVKGGDGYNVYKADKLGAMPWKDLKSPKNGGKQIPTISHWFVCGTTKNTPPETTTPPTKPSKPTETTKPSAPATSAASVSPTSTTAPAAVPAGNESGTGGGLANTGFDNMWLVWIGGLLLVAGGGLLALLKFRRKASE
jgi:LPXTG-motif cell wall-anchored protein